MGGRGGHRRTPSRSRRRRRNRRRTDLLSHPPIAPARAPIREWREIGALATRVEALAKEWKPDVLHAHSPVLDGLAALRVGKKLGIPVIYEIRAFWEDASVGNGTGREGSLRYRLTKAARNPCGQIGRRGRGDLRGIARRPDRARHRRAQDHRIAEWRRPRPVRRSAAARRCARGHAAGLPRAMR